MLREYFSCPAGSAIASVPRKANDFIMVRDMTDQPLLACQLPLLLLLALEALCVQGYLVRCGYGIPISSAGTESGPEGD